MVSMVVKSNAECWSSLYRASTLRDGTVVQVLDPVRVLQNESILLANEYLCCAHAVVKLDRRIRWQWHYTTTILRLCIGARLTRYRNGKFHNFARTISRHADGISMYCVPPSAGTLLPLCTCRLCSIRIITTQAYVSTTYQLRDFTTRYAYAYLPIDSFQIRQGPCCAIWSNLLFVPDTSTLVIFVKHENDLQWLQYVINSHDNRTGGNHIALVALNQITQEDKDDTVIWQQ